VADYCSCGLIRQNKVGIDEHADGVKVCRGCGLPLFDGARVARAAADRASAAQHVLIVTTNDVPGYRIDEVHGDVFGLTVRARNVFSNFGARLVSLAGGEVTEYTKLLSDSRNEARERLRMEAHRMDANAVVAMRFDCNEIGDIMSEIAAYGTAVTISRVAGAVADPA
jgi:uncharacterized protein YbjQ (UPF0145 family)